MKNFFKDFKTFIMRGNVLDLSVAVIIGGAFGSITTSLVNDIFMPLLGILTGGINFSGLFYALDGQKYASIADAQAAGIGTLNYGQFIQNIINFVLIAFCMFCVVRAFNKFSEMTKKPVVEEPKKPARVCFYCKMEIADDATRCPHCTSVLDK